MADAFIYAIKHVDSGRAYVGHTICLKKRFAFHRRLLRRGQHHTPFLQRVWGKYGEAAFVFVVVETCPFKDRLRREAAWIKQIGVFNSVKTPTKVPSRIKISNALRGHVVTKTTRSRISRALRGRPKSFEHRIALGAATRRHSAKARARFTFKGRKHTKSSRLRISRSLRGKSHPCSVAQRRKISLKMRGRKLTKEHRAKISRGLSRFYKARRRG